METIIKPIEITKENFATFGDLISSENTESIDINAGYAKRFDDLANINTLKDEGKTIISIFSAIKRSFPMKIDMMEKHPLGSQAFIPMKETTFLVFTNQNFFLYFFLFPIHHPYSFLLQEPICFQLSQSVHCYMQL